MKYDDEAPPSPKVAGRGRPLLAFAIAVTVLLSTSYYGLVMSTAEVADYSAALKPLLLDNADEAKPCTAFSPPPSSFPTAVAHSKYASIPRVPVHTSTKTVLVTGGAGFIGSHVADALLARGDTVVIVDELNNYYDVALKLSNIDYLFNKHSPNTELQTSTPDTRVSDRLFFFKGDCADSSFLDTVFNSPLYTVDHICHLAARAGVRPSIEDPFVYIHSNILATTQLLEYAVQHSIQNFVYASSSSVYGGSTSTLFSEDEPVDNPVSPYAATKKSCELLAYTYHHLYNLPCSGLRFFTVYGERGRPDMAPYMFIDSVSQGKSINQFGDGTSERDYTYVSDIVDGVVLSLDRPYPYQIFNLGKGSGTSLKDFIGTIEKYVGEKATINLLPEQPGDVPYTRADTEKARELLGYMPKVAIEEGIRRTVEWYKKQRGDVEE